MFASFEFELERGEETFTLEVSYSVHREGARWLREYTVDLEEVTFNGVPFDTTALEDHAILEAAVERAMEDWADQQAAYGDYLHDLRRDY